MSDIVTADQFLTARRTDPARQSDTGAWTAARSNLFGEAAVQSALEPYALCDAGDYFVATNPTEGVGLEGGDAPTDITVDTKPYVFLRNTSTVTEGKRIYLHYILLQVVSATTTTASDALWKAELDTGTTRYSSGGTAITPVNPNMASSSAPSCTLYFGGGTDLTAAAASSSQRLIGDGRLREVIPVLGDIFCFAFGEFKIDHTSNVLAGTTQVNIKVPMPPVILGPTDQFLLHLAGTAQNAHAHYLVRMAFWQR